MGYPRTNVYRLCFRCKRWRPIGNFSSKMTNGVTNNAHTCRRCWHKGIPGAHRAGWTVTPKGRAYLAAERYAAA